MAELVLNIGEVGLGGALRSQLSQILGSASPAHVRWRWVDQDAADARFVHANYLADLGEPGPAPVATVAVLEQDDPQRAWGILQSAPTVWPMSLVSGGKACVSWLMGQLSFLLLQQAVGSALSHERAHIEPGAGAYHLHNPSADSPLLAVIDMARFVVMFSPQATPPDLMSARWVAKPSADGRLTLGFLGASLSTCMWHFASRSRENLLPPRYRQRMIFARRHTSGESALLSREHLEVLEHLRDEPRTLDQLSIDTDWEPERVAKLVEGLYLAGTISTQPRVALGRHSGGTSGLSTNPFANPSATTRMPEDD